MKIGIPKGLYIYNKPILFENFFKNLGCEVIYSKDTDKEILDNGLKFSIDEECLASKIFIGHVYDLAKRQNKENIDYIFVPRICTFKDNKNICVKFFAVYDICKNIFNSKFITLNIDYKKGENEFKAFLKLGKKLGFTYKEIVYSYLKARSMQRAYDTKMALKQYEQLAIESENKSNILIVAHPYIAYDKYIGKEISKYMKKLGANIIYACENKSKVSNNFSKSTSYKEITKSIYWLPSINLINGLNEYLPFVDGIIYLTVFPCGPDSLVNEMLIRKIKDIPSINLILDEQEVGAGVYTRLESFYDIININKNLDKVSGE